MKKIISVLLATVMLLTLIPFSAFTVSAADYTDEQGVTYTLSDDDSYYTVTGFDGSVTEVVICNDIGGIPVTAIGERAFAVCYDLSSIMISDNITYIDPTAFNNCSGLEIVAVSEGNDVYHSRGNCIIETEKNVLVLGCKTSVIPEYITTIDEYAFCGCSYATSLSIPDSVVSINKSAFYGCSGLTSIDIPGSVVTIGDSAFEFCSSLTSLVIPDSVTRIGKYAFARCTGLTGFVIPDTASVGNDIFDGCGQLPKYEYQNGYYYGNAENPYQILYSVIDVEMTDFVFHSDVKIIAERAFKYCVALQSIEIPENITVIGNRTFNGCTALENVTISGSVIRIDEYAFCECDSLTSIELPASVTEIGKYAFWSCDNLAVVVLSDSVTKIGECAFRSCLALTEINIPDSVASIGDSVFASCRSLESITIPASVTDMGASVFSLCNAMPTICCEAESQPEGWSENWTNGYIGTVLWGQSDKKNEVGDVNADGIIDQLDYLLIKRAYFDTYTLSTEEEKRADVNYDSIVDSMDYLLLKRVYFGTYTIE